MDVVVAAASVVIAAAPVSIILIHWRNLSDYNSSGSIVIVIDLYF